MGLSRGCNEKRRRFEMSDTVKRIIIMAIIVIVGFVLGRLAIRGFMNLMLGGTLFGGNFL